MASNTPDPTPAAATERPGGRMIEVIAIGEPGCYAVTGHLNFEDATRAFRTICANYDETMDGFDLPRHTWLLSELRDDQWWYTEVPAHTVDAKPYTIFPLEGHWPRQSWAVQGRLGDGAA